MAIAYTCNLDWFSATLTGDPLLFEDDPEVIQRAGNSVTLQKGRLFNKHYQAGYHVSVSGRPFGVVLVKPREGNALDPGFVQFTADNPPLYEVGFIPEFETVCEVLGWKWRNPTRIDIALDGHGFHEIIRDVMHNKVRQVGRVSYALHFQSQNRLQGYTWGSGKADKYMRCYDKDEELCKSNKWYIKEFWNRAGLDQEENVQRLEVVLRNAELKKYPDFTPVHLDNFEYLATLMRSSLEKWFEFVDPESDSNVSRMEPVEYIDWDSIGGGLLEKCSAIAPNEYFRLKQMAKTCYFIFLSTKSPLFNDLSRECAGCIDHLDWMVENIEKWEAEHEILTAKNSKGFAHFQVLSDLEVQQLLDHLVLIRGGKSSIPGIHSPRHHASEAT